MDSAQFMSMLKDWRPDLLHKEKAAILDVPLETFRNWLYGRHEPTDYVKKQVAKTISEQNLPPVG